MFPRNWDTGDAVCVLEDRHRGSEHRYDFHLFLGILHDEFINQGSRKGRPGDQIVLWTWLCCSWLVCQDLSGRLPCAVIARLLHLLLDLHRKSNGLSNLLRNGPWVLWIQSPVHLNGGDYFDPTCVASRHALFSLRLNAEQHPARSLL